MLQPSSGGLIGSTQPAIAKLAQARIGRARAIARPMHGERRVALDADRTSKAIDGQALDHVFDRVCLAVEQQVIAVVPDHEVEQAFALRAQEPGPDWQRPGDIAGHQPLQEIAYVLPGQADHRAVCEGGASHGP